MSEPVEPSAQEILSRHAERKRVEYVARLYWRLKDWRDGRQGPTVRALENALDIELMALARLVADWQRDDLMRELARTFGKELS